MRANVLPGTSVLVVQKQHQGCGTKTAGTVRQALGRQSQHPRGIKVILEGGVVGRVWEVVTTRDIARQDQRAAALSQAAQAAMRIGAGPTPSSGPE